MKKLSVVIGLLLLLLLPQTASATTEVPGIGGEAYIAIDAASGQVLAGKNIDTTWYPASTTKIMTLVLALEAVQNGQVKLEDLVTTSENAAKMGGSQVYLFPGETRTLNEMLIAIAVGSGNDACVAVAEHLAGTNEAFVEKMNQKAQEIGMANSHFANSHGLHDANHYVTAKDMATLAQYALKRTPEILKYTSIYEYDFRPEPKPLKLWNSNRLLKWYEGTDGLKTGYTKEAKRNLVTTVTRDGFRIISVVLGVSEPKGHFTESMALANYAFNNYQYTCIKPQGTVITNVPVIKGVSPNIDLTAANDVGAIQKKGATSELSTQVVCDEKIVAPIKAGDVLGQIKILANDQELAAIDLIAANDVAKASAYNVWQKIISKVLQP